MIAVRPYPSAQISASLTVIGDVEIGLHVVGRKLEGEGAILHLDVLVDRPAAGVVGEFVLEDDRPSPRRPTPAKRRRQRKAARPHPSTLDLAMSGSLASCFRLGRESLACRPMLGNRARVRAGTLPPLRHCRRGLARLLGGARSHHVRGETPTSLESAREMTEQKTLPPRSGTDFTDQPPAYDPVTQPQLFDGVIGKRFVAFLIDAVIISLLWLVAVCRGGAARHRHARPRLAPVRRSSFPSSASATTRSPSAARIRRPSASA